LTSFSFICWTTDALASVNARIASLEAELIASQKAFDSVTAAKANAKKLHKTTVAKVKKTEKALADANKEHFQREQAIAERLNTISTAAGGTYLSCYLFLLVLLFCIR
jgi:septal ring factor EnvC (AmiA/AmiB activator)